MPAFSHLPNLCRFLCRIVVNTEHNLLLAKIIIKLKLTFKKAYRKPNITALIKKTSKEEANSTGDNDINHTWMIPKENIIQATEKAVGTKRVGTKIKPIKPLWFTLDVKNTCQEKKMAYLQYSTQ